MYRSSVTASSKKREKCLGAYLYMSRLHKERKKVMDAGMDLRLIGNRSQLTGLET